LKRANKGRENVKEKLRIGNNGNCIIYEFKIVISILVELFNKSVDMFALSYTSL